MKIYVDASARCDGDGSEFRPFKRINEAAKIAVAGDEVLVKPGIYREYVNPVNSGTKEAPIVYRSVEPLKAIISGAEEVDDWKLYKGDVWVTRINNGVFNDYNPYTTPVYGDWYFAKDEKHTGCVYLNDKAMYEVDSIEACEKRKYISRRGNKSGAFINGMPMWKVMKPLYTLILEEKIREKKR